MFAKATKVVVPVKHQRFGNGQVEDMVGAGYRYPRFIEYQTFVFCESEAIPNQRRSLISLFQVLQEAYGCYR